MKGILLYVSCLVIGTLVAQHTLGSISEAKNPTSNSVREVFILYANETQFTGEAYKNYKTISKWLSIIGTEKALSIKKSLEQDENGFRDVTKRDVKNIIKGFKSKDPNRYGLAIFTNELAKKGKFIVKNFGTSNVEEQSINFQDNDNYIIKNNPLTILPNFKKSLQRVKDIFQTSDDKIKYSIIIDSHGNQDQAIVSRVSIDSSKISFSSFKSILNGEKKNPFQKLGIKKTEVLANLQNILNSKTSEIEFLFLEACHSHAGKAFSQMNQNINIDNIFMTSTYTPYALLDYSKVFSGETSNHPNLSKLLIKSLEELGPNKTVSFKRNTLSFVISAIQDLETHHYLLLSMLLTMFILLISSISRLRVPETSSS